MKSSDRVTEHLRPLPNSRGWKVVLRSCVDLRLASIYYSIRRAYRSLSGQVLEVGCGNQPYRFLFGPVQYVGIDHEIASRFFERSEDVLYYSGDRFPVEDGRFDAVVHTEVLEHVPHPEHFLAECQRVLKPGGMLLFSIPFSYRYHYIPLDYCRYTPPMLSMLLERGGFEAVEITPQGTDITVACHKIISVFFRLLVEPRPHFVHRLLRCIWLVLFLPILVAVDLVGWISIRLAWGSPDDPLGYFVSARKKARGEPAVVGPRER